MLAEEQERAGSSSMSRHSRWKEAQTDVTESWQAMKTVAVAAVPIRSMGRQAAGHGCGSLKARMGQPVHLPGCYNHIFRHLGHAGRWHRPLQMQVQGVDLREVPSSVMPSLPMQVTIGRSPGP